MIKKIKITYNAGKLARQMPKIIQKHMGRYARSSEKGAKEKIDSGKLRPLKDITIKKRKAKGITGTKPLYETGALHRSIKGRSDGVLTMVKYGIHHHRGFTNNKGTEVPPRPYIAPSEKTILKAFDAFRKNVRKAFKK